MESPTLMNLKLEGGRHQEFVFHSLQSLKMSDNLLISCLDGGTVFTNKQYLGVYCELIKDICMEFPEQEILTVNVDFEKKIVEMMLEYFNTGELKSDNCENLNEVVSLMQVLGVRTDDFKLIEVLPSKKHTRKRKLEAFDPLDVKVKKQKKKVKPEPQETNLNESSTLDEEAPLSWQPAEEHKCEHCGKGFSGKSSLTAHLVTHTAERPFECKECGKFFRSQGALYNHGGVHNPSKCDHCDKCFAQKASLKNHIQTVHPN